MDRRQPDTGEVRPSARVRTAVSHRIGVDPRGLAALRVGIALLLLADLAIRATDLGAFYTDAGVLPRGVLLGQFPGLARLSIHTISGAPFAQAVLFLLAGIAALALLVGYRTRVALVVSWVLLVSLHARNPVLLNAGDSLLRRLLFWGVFLPLGAKWSLDAHGADDRVANLASGALLVQVVIVYVVNAIFKLRNDQWMEGEALRLVFGLDTLTVRFGDILAGFPVLLEGLGWAWLGLLVASPLLILLTGRARAVLVACFAVMHAGMFMTMRLGLFPLISIAALLPFVPPGVWNWIATRRPAGPRIAIPDRPSTRLGLARTVGDRVPIPPWLVRPVRHVPRGAVAVSLTLVLVWNAASLGLVTLPASSAVPADPEMNRWDMFVPPPESDGWYVVPGRLASGEQVDAFHGGPVRWSPGGAAEGMYPGHRWYVYLQDLKRPPYRSLRRPFAAHLCQRWNATHQDGLVELSVFYVQEPVATSDREPTRRIHFLDHSCAAPG